MGPPPQLKGKKKKRDARDVTKGKGGEGKLLRRGGDLIGGKKD